MTTTYTSYFDDGVSRSSAPNDLVYYKKPSTAARLIPTKLRITEEEAKEKYLDQEAKGEYRAVTLSQVRLLTVCCVRI